ncbi:MAG: DUF2335 domain-containing protein [Polyangiaceae bacterium]|nr:DUF2335 domain-containing protein [Polyangiaceae bacterium]
MKSASIQVDDATDGDKRLIRAQAQLHLGALDSPETMLAYKEIDPTFPSRLLQMVEVQAKHRSELEKQTVTAEIARASRGQWLGFAVTSIAFGVVALLGHEGHPWSATVLGSINLVALVGTFVNGRKEAEKRPD